MSVGQMDETYAVALRAALVEHVRATARTAPRRRLRSAATAVIGLAVAGGGVAAASQYLSPPGTRVIEHLGSPVSAVRTGPAAIELGQAPAGADSIDIKLTCLSAGTFTVADGARLTCSDGNAGTGTMSYVLPVASGQLTTTIDTDATSRWLLTLTHSSVRTTPWGVNEGGQTFGAGNGQGTPDLVAVVATNGRRGYAYAQDLEAPTPTSPSEALAWQRVPQRDVEVPVYESDGKTVIGTFVMQGYPGGHHGR